MKETLFTLLAVALGIGIGAQANAADGEEEDPCPDGGVPVVDRELGQVGCARDVPQPIVIPDRPVERPPDDDGGPKHPLSPTYAYHAGICADGLATLETPRGPLRHDDVHLYVEKTSYGPSGRTVTREREETAGFFAKNSGLALAAAWLYVQFREVVFVGGEIRRSPVRTECVMPVVSASLFSEIRSRSHNRVWTRYHLLLQSCQHWASMVRTGKGKEL